MKISYFCVFTQPGPKVVVGGSLHDALQIYGVSGWSFAVARCRFERTTRRWNGPITVKYRRPSRLWLCAIPIATPGKIRHWLHLSAGQVGAL